MAFPSLRRILLGAPIATARQKHERLSKFLALPVFSSDAVSSVAYGPQEVMMSLAVVGAAVWTLSLPIGLAVAILIAIVSMSYRQTIFAYPQGGGSYIVSKDNLGTKWGLIAAASILTDYVLTVAVSVAAGVDAIIAAYPSLDPERILLCIVAIGIVALANLRGLRESGALFAAPTYSFILCLYALVFAGLFKVFSGADIQPVIRNYDSILASANQGLPAAASMFLILRAFSSGCSALTGIEAIADGVPAFKAPESKNAAATMTMMATILATLVLGITYLGHVYQAIPGEFLHTHHLTNVPNYEHLRHQTLVAQIAESVFGRGAFFYIIQAATAAILILAANTAFQDFPRLSSILARDRFAPRQLANIGDRLVFSNGIVLLSLLAGILIVLFSGRTTSLIPLYAVGVFISFTLSQAGMFRRLRRLKQPGWKVNSVISGFGALVTGTVMFVIAISKFMAGAYIVIILIPVLVFVFYKIHQHYIELGNQLRITESDGLKQIKSTSIVLTSGIHKGILPALEYAKSLSNDARALYIEVDPNETALIRDRWQEFNIDMPLVILHSQYRSVNEPILKYIEEAKKERPDHIVTVVVPEFVPAKWWHKALHNQSGLFLKIALMLKRGIVVTNVRYFLER